MNHFAPAETISFSKAFWLYGVGLLSVLYCGAFILVYTSWGRTFGIALPGAFLYIKIALVASVCLWLTRRVYKVVAKAGLYYRGPALLVTAARVMIVSSTAILFIITPLLALSLGVSYRG